MNCRGFHLLHLFNRQRVAGLIAVLIALVGAEIAAADPILNPANGHYYGVVDGAITWDNANTAAQAQKLNGVAGHLVTVASSQENLFLTNTFGAGALQAHWTGGIVFYPVVDPLPPGVPTPPGGPTPPPNFWGGSWVTSEPFTYANFLNGVPTSANGNDQRIILSHTTSSDGVAWDSVAPSTAASGYVVEFDTAVAAAPEPATLALLGSGMLALAGFRLLRGQRRRFQPSRSQTLAGVLVLLFGPMGAERASADPILNPGDGNYYSVVDGSTSWTNAAIAAEQGNVNGFAGHLVTITNSQQNLFLTNTFGAAALQSHWTGGFADVLPNGPPIAGTQPLTVSMWWITQDSFPYSNFAVSGNPAIANGPFQHIMLTSMTNGGGVEWNSVPALALGTGYVVEYDITALPEPVTATLFGAGMLALAGYRLVRRRV